jgi:hypothetical protein
MQALFTHYAKINEINLRIAMKLNEHQEQCLVIEWFRRAYPKYDKLLFAIPNGGVRHIGTAIKLKKEGVVAGIPDLFLMIPNNSLHGMWIEMKASKGKLQTNQVEFMERATLLGYMSVVCYGFEEAKDLITEYLQDYK